MPALVVTVSCPVPPEHTVLPAKPETWGVGFTVYTTSSNVDVHGAFVIVHLKVYVPLVVGVNVAVAFDVLLNCAVDVLGPDGIVHAPVPGDAVFAANVVAPRQIVRSPPAAAAGADAVTVTELFTLDETQPVVLFFTVNTNDIEGGVPVAVKCAVIGDAGNAALVTVVIPVPDKLY